MNKLSIAIYPCNIFKSLCICGCDVCLPVHYIPGVLVHIICSLIYYMYSANTLCTVCVAHTQKR
jgi:hypothetical protein